MNLRFSRTVVLAVAAVLLASAALLFAQEPRKCNASARECEQAIRQMMAGRRYLGITFVELKPGIVIKSVDPIGPGARAGISAGDRIIAINGRSMTDATAKDVKQVLYDARQNGVLWIIVQRRGAYKKIDARLEQYPEKQIDEIIAKHLAQSHTAVAGTNP